MPLFLFLSENAITQEGLYAPSRPEDAALVRVVNLSAEDPSRVMNIGPVSFESLEPQTAGPYRPVPRGVYILDDRDSTVFTPEPETFVTIVLGSASPDRGEAHLFPDEPHDDPARAQLVLYNLTDRILSLVAVPSETVIFPEVEPGRSRAIAVNAIPVDLEIRSGDKNLHGITLRLSRGNSFSLFAAESDGDLRVIDAEASVRND